MRLLCAAFGVASILTPRGALPGAARKTSLTPPRDGECPFIAAAATERGLPLWAVGAAKRKPVLGVEREFDDRSWVNGATGGPLAAAAETAFHGVGKRVEQFGAGW